MPDAAEPSRRERQIMDVVFRGVAECAADAEPPRARGTPRPPSQRPHHQSQSHLPEVCFPSQNQPEAGVLMLRIRPHRNPKRKRGRSLRWVDRRPLPPSLTLRVTIIARFFGPRSMRM